MNKYYISISPDMTIASGYDEEHPEAVMTPKQWEDYEDYTELMSGEERIALADEMIARWQKYKAMQGSLSGD